MEEAAGKTVQDQEENPCSKRSENNTTNLAWFINEIKVRRLRKRPLSTVEEAAVRKRMDSREIWSAKCGGYDEVNFHKVFAAFVWL